MLYFLEEKILMNVAICKAEKALLDYSGCNTRMTLRRTWVLKSPRKLQKLRRSWLINHN
jgi:hypothetical protein